MAFVKVLRNHHLYLTIFTLFTLSLRLWCSSSQSQELLELVNCEAVSREETSVPSPTRSPSTRRLEVRSTMETMETTTATMGRPLSW